MAQAIVREGRDLINYKQTQYDRDASDGMDLLNSRNCDEIQPGLWLGK